MTIPLNASALDVEVPPRPKDVGILAMEMYFPRRVSLSRRVAVTLAVPDSVPCARLVHLRGGAGGV